MLPTNWMVFLVMLWVLASLLCATCEGAWLGPGTQSVLTDVMHCSLFTADSTLGKIAGVFSPDLWKGLLDMVTFNYGIFYGTWELVRWVLLMPLTIVVVYSVALTTAKLIRGIGSGL